MLEIDVYQSNIPKWMNENIDEITDNYDDLSESIYFLKWPETKKEKKKFIKRLIEYYSDKKSLPKYKFSTGSSYDYLNLTVSIEEFAKPRNRLERILRFHREFMEKIDEYRFPSYSEIDNYDD